MATTRLLVPAQECIFNDQGQEHEDPAIYLRELLHADLLMNHEIEEDDSIEMESYDAIAIEEGFVVFSIEYEVEDRIEGTVGY